MATHNDHGRARDAVCAAARLAQAREAVAGMRAAMADEDRRALRFDLEDMYDEDGLPA